MTQEEGAVRLDVEHLSKTFGEGEQTVHAVKDVSFVTEPGEFVAIVGPSGSGKTTLLAMVGGLLTPSSGSIVVNGRDIAQIRGGEQAAYRRERVGYVFQANNLLPFLTARENLLVISQITRANRKAAGIRANQLLEELGLTARANALVTELSGGERQRVTIGRALMNDPELVLVDEPTASLDSERGRQVVDSLIREVKSRNKLGLMVTHDLAMANLADRILAMHDGAMTELAKAETQPA
jgi:putative ABC transport system ATP-binding protein